MPTWPVSLPEQLLVEGYAEALSDNLIRDDLGDPADIRRRSTAAPFPFGGRMLMTTEQWSALKTFFSVDLFDGALSFTFPPQGCPDGVTSWIARFTQPPTRTYSDEDSWNIAMVLEVLRVE
jgi:hypothetical protein